MTKRKVVFVIVEGPSDRHALGVLLSNLYDKDQIFIYVTHGDITSSWEVTPANIASKICTYVKEYKSMNYFKKGDFKEVIHIVDMDGAYVPDEAIIHDENAIKVIYSTKEIHTCNPEMIVNRNQHKRANIERLKSMRYVWSTIPYSVYYMSCNLDHVLYNKLNSSDEEKEADSLKFAQKYEHDVSGFISMINESELAPEKDYHKSWQYITEQLHSLERHTNLGICFRKDGVIQEDQ